MVVECQQPQKIANLQTKTAEFTVGARNLQSVLGAISNTSSISSLMFSVHIHSYVVFALLWYVLYWSIFVRFNSFYFLWLYILLYVTHLFVRLFCFHGFALWFYVSMFHVLLIYYFMLMNLYVRYVSRLTGEHIDLILLVGYLRIWVNTGFVREE